MAKQHPKVWTPQRAAQLGLMLGWGDSLPDIGKKFGISQEGVVKACQRLGLDGRQATAKGEQFITLRIARPVMTVLDRAAERRRVSRVVMAERLLKAVAEDGPNLLDNVLDDGVTS